MLEQIFVPPGHSLESARRVMADTKRLFSITRPTMTVNARCASATKAPARAATTTPPSASDLYFSAVEEQLEKGMTVKEARRAVAVQQRSLLDGYLREHTAQASNRAERKRQEAARARTARNSH